MKERSTQHRVRSSLHAPLLSRRQFLRRGAALSLLTAAAGSIAWWYATDFEPHHLEISNVKVPIARLPQAFNGLRLGQISDLHLGPNVSPQQVRMAVDAVIALKPDIAVVTGDFVSRVTNGEAEQVESELSRLTAPLGVFAILGNHEYWTDPELVARSVRRANVNLLRNQSSAINRDRETIHIAGVDDVWEKHSDLGVALKGIDDSGFVILLAHEPDFADEAARDGRVALQLSGHSHGGQVRIPGFGGVFYPELARKYNDGLYDVGGMRAYVNRGIGVVKPPVRFNCPPQVSILELVRQE